MNPPLVHSYRDLEINLESTFDGAPFSLYLMRFPFLESPAKQTHFLKAEVFLAPHLQLITG